MKTSNKLIFAALVLTVVLLTWQDLRLKAEYLSGAYKIPYSNYVTLNYTGFDIVVVDLGIEHGFDAGFVAHFGILALTSRLDEFGETNS